MAQCYLILRHSLVILLDLLFTINFSSLLRVIDIHALLSLSMNDKIQSFIINSVIIFSSWLFHEVSRQGYFSSKLCFHYDFQPQYLSYKVYFEQRLPLFNSRSYKEVFLLSVFVDESVLEVVLVSIVALYCFKLKQEQIALNLYRVMC